MLGEAKGEGPLELGLSGSGIAERLAAEGALNVLVVVKVFP